MRVLLLHNRYREVGGEERLVATSAALLRSRGIECKTLERSSSDLSKLGAARGLLGGGVNPDEVGRAVAESGADLVHAHNIHPSFGYRALAAARAAGAKVVLHLHNFRLFCAIGTSYRDGRPCYRCSGSNTWPGVRLRCRGGATESVVYGIGLARAQPRIFELVDHFIVPSNFGRDQLVRLGLPEDRVEVIANPAPADSLVDLSSAGDGQYALYVGRLSAEKGIDTAVAACRQAGVSLKVAGSGDADVDDGDVDLLGHLDAATLAELRRGAAMALVPSRGPEIFPFAGLEAMAAGLPLLVSNIGGLPEMAGSEQVLPPGDTERWQAACKALMSDSKRRSQLGESNLALARERFSEAGFVERLISTYENVCTASQKSK